ncbi:hypothetical protein E2C01_090645 [Portunus trituberculatus]|uniref:Uncharacterized protein n=1 Tax=Portunus trituberculatus TaxID=210409 RepID=A0A5B7JLX4_PORTR|nr:hypothetical protein [Portunus trituberculatus]
MVPNSAITSAVPASLSGRSAEEAIIISSLFRTITLKNSRRRYGAVRLYTSLNNDPHLSLYT